MLSYSEKDGVRPRPEVQAPHLFYDTPSVRTGAYLGSLRNMPRNLRSCSIETQAQERELDRDEAC